MTLSLLTTLVLLLATGPLSRAQAAGCVAELARTSVSRPLSSVLDSIEGNYVTTYWVRETSVAAEFTTVVHALREVRSERPVAPDRGAFDAYFAAVEPLVHLANQKFERRRGWGAGFSEKNVKVARAFLDQSSYVTIFAPTGRLIAGIRNIHVPHHWHWQLPEEEFLMIILPRLGLARTKPDFTPWKNEIGTFVIEEDLLAELRRKLTLELWSHLFRIMFSKNSVRANYYDQAFHTYGNRESLLMYRPLGFKKLRTYRHEGRLVNYEALNENEVPPILIDGEPWWPIVLLADEVGALNRKFTLETRAGVAPEWLEDRRRALADGTVGARQLGALYAQLARDLTSADDRAFDSALAGIFDLITSAAAHADVAIAAFRDRRLSDAAIGEIVEIRGHLDEFVLRLHQRLPQFSAARRRAVAEFFGTILRYGDRAFAHLYDWGFFKDGVFVLLVDADPRVARAMAESLPRARTPKQWMEGTGFKLDLTQIGDGREFYDDVVAGEAELRRRLTARGRARREIERVNSVVSRWLFARRFNFPGRAVRALRGCDAAEVYEFVNLAAVRRYLAEAPSRPPQ